jgi:hypothetical protein
MNTPIVPQPLNPNIVQVISDLVWEAIEHDPEYRGAMDPFFAAIQNINKKIATSDLRAIESCPFAVAYVVGRAMLEMGLKIGRNPETLLTLPECGNQR